MSSDDGDLPVRSWRIAEQRFLDKRFAEVAVEPQNDGYVLTIWSGGIARRVYFDPAGRITHVRDAY